jgi:ABC-type multidrug transport system fused ATPase/permease subunit
MDSLIQQLTDKPILLAVALILVAVVVYALMKRLIKLALFLLVLLAVYFGYLYMTGQDFPEGVQKGQEMLEDVKDKASEFFNEHKDDIDKVKKKLTTEN